MARDSSMRKVGLAVAFGVLLACVFAAGYFIGRGKLEREWRLAPMPLSESDVGKTKATEGADPPPPAGTKVLAAMPLEKFKGALASFTEKDPVRATIGSVGRSDGEGGELSLVLKSTVDCEITQVDGVVYGFDSKGGAATLNKGGEHYMGFSIKEKIPPKAEKATLTAPVKNPGTTAIALAQVDHYTCANGTSWARQ